MFEKRENIAGSSSFKTEKKWRDDQFVARVGQSCMSILCPLDLSRLVTLCDIKRKTCFGLLFTSACTGEGGRNRNVGADEVGGVAQEIRKRNDYVPAFCTNSQNMADNMTEVEIFPCCSIQYCPLNCNFLLNVHKPGSKVPFQINGSVYYLW